MIRPIIRDPIILSAPCEKATLDDIAVADDLLDTLAAHAEECVGLAANMIGVNKRIIVFNDGHENREMFNPIVLRASGPYLAEEGCLSLEGRRQVRRFQDIKVQWMDRAGRRRTAAFSGFTAEIILHEIDHCKGILI